MTSVDSMARPESARAPPATPSTGSHHACMEGISSSQARRLTPGSAHPIGFAPGRRSAHVPYAGFGGHHEMPNQRVADEARGQPACVHARCHAPDTRAEAGTLSQQGDSRVPHAKFRSGTGQLNARAQLPTSRVPKGVSPRAGYLSGIPALLNSTYLLVVFHRVDRRHVGDLGLQCRIDHLRGGDSRMKWGRC